MLGQIVPINRQVMQGNIMNQKSKPVEIDFNAGFKRAIALMEETQRNILITGRAGTGKSTLLTYFRNSTKKNVVILAPTGVAAVNVEGQTIHSFFHFKPNVTPASIKRKKKSEKDKPTIYKKLTTIVIDEVSMVRPICLTVSTNSCSSTDRMKSSPSAAFK